MLALPTDIARTRGAGHSEDGGGWLPRPKPLSKLRVGQQGRAVSHSTLHTARMLSRELSKQPQVGPQSSLGDRAVVIAGILAIVIVGPFGAEREEAPGPVARSAQSAHR